MKFDWKYFFLGMAITAIPMSILVYRASPSSAEVLSESAVNEELITVTESNEILETKVLVSVDDEEVTPEPTDSPTPTPTDTPTPSPTPVPTDTPAPTPTPHRIAPAEIDALIVRYASEYGTDANLIRIIADCESHFNPQAVNGPYGGMFQYTATSWASKRNEMVLDPNPDLRFNAEESIRTTAYAISRYGTGMWPACTR